MNAVDRDEEGMMEANVTGTGASFTAGTGAGYMTPKAFKNLFQIKLIDQK